MRKNTLLFFAGALLLLSCSEPKEPITIKERCNLSALPEGVALYGFKEEYEQYKGTYRLLFFMKNTSKKKIEYPEVEADLYVKGVKEGTPLGGPGKHLLPGDSGVVSLSWILPKSIPDSLIFRSN